MMVVISVVALSGVVQFRIFEKCIILRFLSGIFLCFLRGVE